MYQAEWVAGRMMDDSSRTPLEVGGVCQVPQYMLLSDEIGPWAGDITKAKLPDHFMVDYVRVYDVVATD